ncbi:MAG: hypothetical protein R3293_08205 [Candidatus Promineifilaceae bacterium]|nr:hypothetical protein [Candidatus Promineifilaceae bacterium]
MNDEETGTPDIYEIEVAGQLDDHWQPWFDGLTMSPTANGHTRLSGPIRDQAALHGVLKRISSLGLKLIAIILIKGDDTCCADHHECNSFFIA